MEARAALDRTLQQHARQGFVVAKRALLPRLEAIEHREARVALHIGDDRPRVVQLVAGGDEQGRDRLLLEAGEIDQLALAPVGVLRLRRVQLRLGLGGAVRAVLHDGGHGLAELGADGRFVSGAAVLEHVVQQAGDGLVLVAAVLQHDAGDAQQVVEVGDGGALAELGGVGDAGVLDGLAVTLGQNGHGRTPSHVPLTPAARPRPSFGRQDSRGDLAWAKVHSGDDGGTRPIRCSEEATLYQ